MTPRCIDEANELVLRRIAEAGDEMILGFLPLSKEQGQAVLRIVRESLQGGLVTINGLLEKAPAATTYALAVAPSRSLTSGGNFWPSLHKDLGLEVDPSMRRHLSVTFLRTCQQLGLLAQRIGDVGWILADPFIFQAGMLYYWREALASGLKLTLRNLPAPDSDSEETMERFLNELKRHIFNQPTLKKILQTPVGGLLVRRLIVAYQQGDYSVLPPHLQKPMRDAFEGAGRGMVLRAPYLAYDVAFKQIELVLPTQSTRVATPNTCWQVANRRYAARSETRLPLNELPNRRPKVKLQDLAGSFQEQAFHMDARVDETVPFRIFREDSLRERRADAGKSCSVPPGNYLIVMAEAVHAGEDESDVLDFSGYRVLRDVELRPGDEPVELRLGETRWEIGCALAAGVFVDHERARTLPLDDGRLIHYGPEFGLVTYFPEVVLDDVVPVLELVVGNQTFRRTVSLGADMEKGGVIIFSEAINRPMKEMMDELPPGLHFVQITVTRRTRTVNYSFVYWEGLREISELQGFQCEQFPENIDFRRSKGIEQGNDGSILFQEGFHAPSISIAISGTPESLNVRRSGLQAILVSPGEDWEEEPDAMEPIIVLQNDRRAVRFQSGGFQEWEILCGNVPLAKLTTQRTRFAVSLAGLSTQFGGSGEVSARGNDGQQIPLLAFSKPLTAWRPDFHQDDRLGIGKWILTVPAEDLQEIGVRKTDFSDYPEPSQTPIVPFTSFNYHFSKEFFEVEDGVSLSTRKIDRNGTSFIEVSLEFQEDSLRGKLLLVDFYRKAQLETRWFPLQCVERQGYSSLRIVLMRRPSPVSFCSWWQRLRCSPRPENDDLTDNDFGSRYEPLKSEELEDALVACRNLLSWKYPQEVWHREAEKFRDLPVHLGNWQFNEYDSTAAIWWEQGALELVEHSAAKQAPVVRQFLFASQPASLRIPLEQLPLLSGCQFRTLLGRSLTLSSEIRERGGLIHFVPEVYHDGFVSQEAFEAFSQFNQVIHGRAESFGSMELKWFLESLFAKTEELAENHINLEVDSLLSPRHLFLAVRLLNRRCRPVETAAASEDDHVLLSVAQMLATAYQQLSRIGQPIAERFGINLKFKDPCDEYRFNSWWTPPCLANGCSLKVADLVWGIAAISRLAAHRKIDSSRFQRWIGTLLNTSRDCEVRNRLGVLLSLAPELFAFYVGLFDLALCEEPPN